MSFAALRRAFLGAAEGSKLGGVDEESADAEDVIEVFHRGGP